MTIRDRLNKVASEAGLITKGFRLIPDKYKMPVVGGASIATYVGGKQALKDAKEGRKGRKRQEAEQRYNRMMSKQAQVSHMGRDEGQLFPLASESGAISWRQSLLDGLFRNKEKMGKMSHNQLSDLFPASADHKTHKHGYRQRSMTSGKDAGSSLIKAFKTR
jgi:hypothetical protein